LERGHSVPAFMFVETEQTARTVDDELVEVLSQTSIPKQVWPEMLGMSLESRKAFAAYLDQQVL
jgi:hypothetical protein